MLSKCKTTVREIEKLTGFLNFLCHFVIPGNPFMRRLYAQYFLNMKPYHHISVNSEIKGYLNMWTQFVEHPSIYCRPFVDFEQILTASTLDWHTDASGKIGCGGILNSFWFKAIWPQEFLELEPSIEYLELFGITVNFVVGKILQEQENLSIL